MEAAYVFRESSIFLPYVLKPYVKDRISNIVQEYKHYPFSADLDLE